MLQAASWPSFYLCARADINLDVCLDMGGQSFTWIRVSEDSWLNCFASQPVLILRKDGAVFFSCQNPSEENSIRALLSDYFRLSEDLPALYKLWCKDAHFKASSKAYQGIRLLRQDPVETLFAFICSQNNAIPRITKLVQALKSEFGDLVGEHSGHKIYSFPPPHHLADPSIERRLRSLGFGYRAKYIQQAAALLASTSLDLPALRTETYPDVHQRLLTIPGVGPKVADCVALMSLDQLGAVPIDTHIWQVACKHYRFPGVPMLAGKSKASMNKAVYQGLGEGFRKVFGEKAGWAHLILFAAQQRK